MLNGEEKITQGESHGSHILLINICFIENKEDIQILGIMDFVMLCKK